MKAIIYKTSWFNQHKQDDKPCDGAVWNEQSRRWFIEVETIADILKIADWLVITTDVEGDDCDFYIEIYDDYRE